MKDRSSQNLLSAAYITLGCKVNQYETEEIRHSFETIGFVTVRQNEPADVYVINTCSVTHIADSKSRAAIRKAIRANPQALVVVTGCYSQLEPLDVASIDGVDIVIPNDQKDSICGYVVARLGIHTESILKTVDVPYRLRTRAVVKVQDGCDNYCSYCIIPYARPQMKSRSLHGVIDEIKALVDAGFQEIVLAGIRLGSYRWENMTIADLVRHCAAVNGLGRIRLSSIEPWEVTDNLLDAMDTPKVCRHLHIPLQSGDDAVLAAMNRRYDTRDYLGILDCVRKRIPGIGISSDIIAGFPGEDSDAHERSLAIVRAASFSRLHVFRFSSRSRTAAAEMPGQVGDSEKRQRAEQLENLGMEQQRAFASLWLGRTLPVLLESEIKVGGICRGYTDNYIEVNVASAQQFKNKIVNVKISAMLETGTVQGELLAQE